MKTNTKVDNMNKIEQIRTIISRREGGCVYGPLWPCDNETLGIFVLDGSVSMEEQTARGWTKADSVSQAVSDIISMVKHSRQRINFSFSIVNYDHRSVIKMRSTPAKDIDEHVDFNPMEGLGGATYISEGLKDAKRIAEDYLSQSQKDGLNRNVVVMLLTDGMDMTIPETISIAESLKHIENVKITGCFFETLGADSDETRRCSDHIQHLCSAPTDFRTVDDYLPLREFFLKSIENNLL